MTDVSGEKAQIFNDFLLVFSLLTMAALQSYLSVRVDTDICLTPITFTPSIVRRTIHKLKATLSSGIDGISNCFLKKCADSLCLPFCHIFDTSFKSNTIPEQWRSAIVVPVHKKRCH